MKSRFNILFEQIMKELRFKGMTAGEIKTKLSENDIDLNEQIFIDDSFFDELIITDMYICQNYWPDVFDGKCLSIQTEQINEYDEEDQPEEKIITIKKLLELLNKLPDNSPVYILYGEEETGVIENIQPNGLIETRLLSRESAFEG